MMQRIKKRNRPVCPPGGETIKTLDAGGVTVLWFNNTIRTTQCQYTCERINRARVAVLWCRFWGYGDLYNRAVREARRQHEP